MPIKIETPYAPEELYLRLSFGKGFSWWRDKGGGYTHWPELAGLWTGAEMAKRSAYGVEQEPGFPAADLADSATRFRKKVARRRIAERGHLRLYVASSWRNEAQPQVVAHLREAGHEVYDFRSPPGGAGFGWSEIDPAWSRWSPEQYLSALEHPRATANFTSDYDAMKWADGCVLVLPCGSSAHMEAGWAVGADKPVWVLMGAGPREPELMLKMVTAFCATSNDLTETLSAYIASCRA